MIYKSYKTALFMILSTSASSQMVAMTPEQLAQFQNKYSQSPIERCKNAGCKNTEECFNLHKKLLSAERVSQKTIEKNLTLDEQILKNAAAQFWGRAFFSAWQPTEYNTAISCLAHLAEQRNYLPTNAAIEEEAQNLINKGKNLPADEQSLQARVLSEQHTTNYPFENFRAQCNKDLQIIGSWLHCHSREFPILAGKLEATKLVIGRVQERIYDRAQAEREKKSQAEYLADNKTHHQALLRAEQDKNRIVQEQAIATNNLYRAVNNIPWYKINHADKSTLYQIEQSIRQIKEQANLLDINTRSLECQLNDWQTQVNQALSYQKKQEELNNLQISNLKKEEAYNRLKKQHLQLSQTKSPTGQEWDSIRLALRKAGQESRSLDENIEKATLQKIEFERALQESLRYYKQIKELESVQSSIQAKITDFEKLEKNQLLNAEQLNQLQSLQKQLQEIASKNKVTQELVATLLKKQAAATVTKNSEQKNKSKN